MPQRTHALCITLVFAFASLRAIAAEEPEPMGPVPDASQGDLTWGNHYGDAVQAAQRQGKMMLIYFQPIEPTGHSTRFESETLADPEIQDKLRQFVLVQLPVDAQIVEQGQTIKLLEHAAFDEMLGEAGVAILDYVSGDSETFGHVVSTFPFVVGKVYDREELDVVLDLPQGTLTQRTMIFAVRTHPESPKSTLGEFNPVLADEAESHSRHQARIRLQGHHNWDNRFRRIASRLRTGASSTEVVAESWPGEHLVEAAIDCVNSWRQSPGHWGAVRSRHALFGYDIKRGSNGIWYATGIFSGRR